MRRLLNFAVFVAVMSVTLPAEIQARIVKGKVTCGNENISQVIVTDGTNFTRTKKDGTFKMGITDTARFVYIITPSGFCADWSSGSPEFYQKAQGKEYFSFDLIKTGEDYSKYNIIAIADPQPSKEEHCVEYRGAPLQDVSQTISALDGPTVGVVLGDICFDVYHLLENWKESVKNEKIPFYTIPGNHDHDKKILNDKESLIHYNKLFGPEFYAFFMGDDLVIMLDNIIQGRKSGRNRYTLGYTDEVVSWVRKLMKHIPKDTHIYVCHHSPLSGRNKDLSFIYNGQKLVDVLKGHRINFISGHNHVNYNFRYGDITEHSVAALCGTWWDAYHCTDGTPRGYKVYTKEGEDLTWYYKSVGKDKSFQYEIFRPGECSQNPDKWVLNVWDIDHEWRVEWMEDSKPMGQMKKVKEYNPLHIDEINDTFEKIGKPVTNWKKTKLSKHYFAASPSAEAKSITFIIKSSFGDVWSETIQLQ